MSNWNGYCCTCGGLGHRPANCRFATGAEASAPVYRAMIRYLPSLTVPVGMVVHSSVLAQGYMLANGALVSKRVYSDLYAVVGDRWARAGDAESWPEMFRLPDLRDVQLTSHSLDVGRSVDDGRAV